ncbi:MAG: phosphonoacetaldehyde hydrolase [Clostridium sp.]|nr:phosphonoacetaldehyde hydrolase [Clostridium sp.]
MANIECVIFDWAGTTVDYGCFAPVHAFMEVFRAYGMEPTMEETRKPMGMLKRDHIKTMLGMPNIKAKWLEKHGRPVTDADIDAMHDRFEEILLESLGKFTTPKPHTVETVNQLREKGIKIGSTTGYNDIMMEIVTKGAKEQGYAPDFWITPNSVFNCGRPYPYMIFRNMEELKVSHVKHCVKVGDTVSDIKEAVHAGVWAVGVVEGSSELGFTEEEYNALSESERQKEIKRVTESFQQAGADFVIANLSELPSLLETI